MPIRTHASHTIQMAAPIAQCQRFFTPAGEELWVSGWQPTYIWPADGRTEPGMTFTTGAGDTFTIWTLLEFTQEPYVARYSRVTPSSRCGIVDVRCHATSANETAVTVTYSLTALTDIGARELESFDGPAFTAQIDEWKALIDARLPLLLDAAIR